MNTGSAAGLPSASAHCCHLPMRSGRGPGTRRPQRTRLRLGTSRPLTAQPHGLRPQTRLGRQTATSPGAHTRRRGRRAERAPLRPPRHPRPPCRPGRSLHSAHVWAREACAPLSRGHVPGDSPLSSRRRPRPGPCGGSDWSWGPGWHHGSVPNQFPLCTGPGPRARPRGRGTPRPPTLGGPRPPAAPRASASHSPGFGGLLGLGS